jgi:hypothetical protein
MNDERQVETHEVGDEVIVIGAEYGEVLEVLERDHYLVDVDNRGVYTLAAKHLQATGRKALHGEC